MTPTQFKQAQRAGLVKVSSYSEGQWYEVDSRRFICWFDGQWDEVGENGYTPSSRAEMEAAIEAEAAHQEYCDYMDENAHRGQGWL